MNIVIFMMTIVVLIRIFIKSIVSFFFFFGVHLVLLGTTELNLPMFGVWSNR